MNSFTAVYVFASILFVNINLVLSAEDLNSLNNGSATANVKNLFGVREQDVTFRLYTRSNPNNYQMLFTGLLHCASFANYKLFKFIIHGWTFTANDALVIKMKNEYLSKGDYNVIAVDWRIPASSIIYPIPVLNTKIVGRFLARLIEDLNRSSFVLYTNIHLIGHSLGAHVAGYAGQFLTEFTGQKISRITGMDPAGPAFFGRPPSERLSPEDASFVDVIHTAGGLTGYYGVCGHADFYPNGGTVLQPGCLKGNLEGELLRVGCSHLRSYVYFTESINSWGFFSRKCGSILNYILGKCNANPGATMGENVHPATRGVFFLITNAQTPFAKFGQI